MRTTAKREFARQLRRNPTDAERLLWRHLRNRQLLGHRFRRQHPFGPYVLDFICLEQGLVVEVDGGQHAGSASDATRDAWLAAHGLAVLRFWNDDLLLRTNDVLQSLVQALSSRVPA